MMIMDTSIGSSRGASIDNPDTFGESLRDKMSTRSPETDSYCHSMM
ncbi:hypothetical protein [Paramesorhizobium deserti]|nr:hypothetical protein [Paramesorhizobium deserti]